MDRRGFIVLTGAWLALPSFASAQVPAPPGSRRFFTADEHAFVEAAVDRLIPDEPEWPGARAALVPTYIDAQLAGPFGQGERMYQAGPHKPGKPGQGYQLPFTPAEVYRRSLTAILRETDGGRGFLEASPEEQDDYLKRLEAGEVELDGVPSAVFFETLLANTVEGYFADPVYGGNKDMAAWRMIGFPGAHAAFLGIYTQHGIRWDRPPVSLADHGAGHAHEHN